MGILGSMFTGVSGLATNGLALSIIGDNIANTNTSGFKGSRAVFADVLSQASTGGSAMQIGRGSQMLGVQQLFTQGTFETTANPLDMGIDGDGFFVIKEYQGGTFYTRAGQYLLNKEGFMVSPQGLRLQGYLYNDAGNPTGAIGDINVATVNSNPNSTDTMNIQVNLDSRSTVPTAAWSVSPTTGAAPGSYNFQTNITIYDSLGNAHPVGVYFRRTPTPGQWQARIVADTGLSGSPNYVEVGGSPITVTFDTSGQLTSPLTATPITFPWVPGWGAVTPQSVNIFFGYAGNNSTQYGSPSTTIFQTQDGWTSGSLRALTVGQDGILSGVFTNGQVKNIAQVTIAKFTNPAGLTKMGRNMFAESSDSGQPAVGSPGTSGRGKILANSLEMSNIDLADEFVKMIAAQRGFQANTRVITTSDGLLGEVMNIVR